MNKISFLFLLLLLAITLIGSYNALFAIDGLTYFIRVSGLVSFFLVCISLLIGPLNVIFPGKYAPLIEPRRAIGIASFFFAFVHFALFFFMKLNGNLTFIYGTELFYIALPALLLMFVLTITSCDYAVKKLGIGTWKNIQRFTYLLFLMIFAHFFLKSNGLFAQYGNMFFINLSEMALVLLGCITIILQIYAFYLVRKRGSEAKEQQL